MITSLRRVRRIDGDLIACPASRMTARAAEVLKGRAKSSEIF
jgi:hypothetical protein